MKMKDPLIGRPEDKTPRGVFVSNKKFVLVLVLLCVYTIALGLLVGYLRGLEVSHREQTESMYIQLYPFTEKGNETCRLTSSHFDHVGDRMYAYINSYIFYIM
jgi:hypothetical protein